MNTDKKSIRHLAHICAQKGLHHVVLSPGSRCAPLVIAFNREDSIHCYSITDERCAAFCALGMAQQMRQPVALVCTSGSAVLNYAPAISEAFYQKIPLIILTADRPNEWIDQGENQSILQYDVYKNYIKKSYQLPIDNGEEKDIWYSDRIINEAINKSMYPDCGPVHINIPLREPLYSLTENSDTTSVKIIQSVAPEKQLSQTVYATLARQWEQCQKKLIIVGGGTYNLALKERLISLYANPSVVILSESISNVHGVGLGSIDALMEVISKGEQTDFLPDLIVSFGGGLVSKRIKFFFRRMKRAIEHWHISPSDEHWDNLQCLTKVLNTTPLSFFEIMDRCEDTPSAYQKKWRTLKHTLDKHRQTYLSQSPYTDFTVFAQLLSTLPSNTNLHLGNSTPVRYADIIEIPSSKDIRVNANRGVSGIDGQVSTAVGASMVNQKRTICITGDVAFLYDSNAMWNKYVNSRFKIILINNGGGNIFRIIPGPDRLLEIDDYFETTQEHTAEHLTRMYGFNYYSCTNLDELALILPTFYAYSHNDRPDLLEIKTPSKTSAEILRRYFKYITEKTDL